MHPEVATCWGAISRRVDRLVACLHGLGPDGLNWRPPAPDTNSLYALATHTIANVEENLLGILCGQPVTRDHAAEFGAVGQSATPVIEGWAEVWFHCDEALEKLSTADLDRTYDHPRRGPQTGREILLVILRHVAEHEGQAQLTRDLLLATNSPTA